MSSMIDMVFLLLVFFMVSAKPVVPEQEIPMGLPGQMAQEESLDIPDEMTIVIESSGQIVVNERRLDGPTDRNLPNLRAVLLRFAQAAKNAQSEALVTVDPDDAAVHQRIVDVLTCCSEAGLVKVSLSGGGEDG